MIAKRKKRKNSFVKQTHNTSSKKKGGIIKAKLLISLVVIVLLVLSWLFFISGIFTIKATVFPDTKNITQFDLEKVIWDQTKENKLFILPQANLIFLDKNDLADRLHDNFQIGHLKIKKHWPSTLVIELEEKDYSVIWQEGDIYFYINRSGDIILEKFSQPQNLLVIANLGVSKREERRIIVDTKYLDAVSGLDQQIKVALPDLTVQQYLLDDEINTFKAKVEEGPLLYFNTEEDIVKQVAKLSAVINETFASQAEFKRQTYIDLRYGDRVFYQ